MVNASEYDPDEGINLHTEFSYSGKWPSKLIFSCLKTPSTDGETSLGDCRKMLKLLDPDVVKEFESKKIKYIRNLHNGSGFGPSWQNAFATDKREIVEEYCRLTEIDFEWRTNGNIKLIQTRPAIRKHPVTTDKIWFNQVEQFYPALFKKEIYETLLQMNDYDETELPMYSTFGDGSKISMEIIKHIQQLLEQVTVKRIWQRNSLLLVDNMLNLHGRMPYKGEREVYVSMI